jgi:hypothetical protein
MRGRIEMKKNIAIIFIAAALLLLATCPTSTAAPWYESYLSIRPGNTFSFTYTMNPDDQSHQSPLSVDLSFVINTIVDNADNASSNITYTATYKVLVEGIPKDQAHVTTRTISNSTNSTAYVYNATTPWELFFTNNRNTTARTVDVPANKSLDIGYGYVTWDVDGVLSIAYFYTLIDGAGCLVTILRKAPGGGAVPGYSTALILIVAAIPTALLAYKIARKAHRETVE